MVIWITGISGAGKTTLANAIVRRFKPKVPELIQIDGDEIRALFGPNLSYREEDRYTHIGRIQKLAHMLDKQGALVVVGALYAHPRLLDWNRKNFTAYLEVYIDAPLDLVKARDAKGLYAKAEAGKMPHVVGIDVPWHAPTRADMVIDAKIGRSPDELAFEIALRTPRLAVTLEQSFGAE